MATEWELRDGDQHRGPLSEGAVVDAILTGSVSPTTLVRPVGKTKWKDATAHSVFAAAFERTPGASTATVNATAPQANDFGNHPPMNHYHGSPPGYQGPPHGYQGPPPVPPQGYGHPPSGYGSPPGWGHRPVARPAKRTNWPFVFAVATMVLAVGVFAALDPDRKSGSAEATIERAHEDKDDARSNMDVDGEDLEAKCSSLTKRFSGRIVVVSCYTAKPIVDHLVIRVAVGSNSWKSAGTVVRRLFAEAARDEFKPHWKEHHGWGGERAPWRVEVATDSLSNGPAPVALIYADGEQHDFQRWPN